MFSTPSFVIPTLKLRFSLFVVIILASISVHPVISYPSTSLDNHHHHHIHRQNTDLVPEQSVQTEDEEQILPEINEDEEFQLEEELQPEDDVNFEAINYEDYPQQDMPAMVDDAVADNGHRKGEVKHPKSHHNGKNGRRNSVDQKTPVKTAPEANDTIISGTAEDFNLEESNKTLSDGNSSSTDDNAIRLSINNRERNKALRINAIKEMIQNYRHGVLEPSRPITFPPIDKSKVNISQPLDAYPMKRRSFHPSCTLPNNTDIELWSDGNPMNLLFNLTYPAPQNTTITIIAAMLRLYKVAQGNHTTMEQPCSPQSVSAKNTEHEDEETEEPLHDSPVLPEIPVLPSLPGTVGLVDDDKQIRVSVYWYTRSLKKNKVKRKLLDSRMLSIYSTGEWIEFNVRHAVRQWRLLGKNFGLVVEVENEDGELLKATEYFTAMNCSNEASIARPLPGVLLHEARSYLESNYASSGTGFDISPLISGATGFIYTHPGGNNSPSSGYNGGRKRDLGDETISRRINNSPFVYSFLFPVIDMCTVEIPAQEAANAAFLQHAQYVLTQHLAACKNQTDMHGVPPHTVFPFLHGLFPHKLEMLPITTEVNDTGNFDNNQTSDFDSSSHIKHVVNKHHHHPHHHQGHVSDVADSPQAIKIRHSRHQHGEKHTGKQRNQNNNNNNNFDETSKRRINGENEKESEEIKEEVTWTDENGNEFKEKVVIREEMHSANHHDSSVLPENDSDR